MKTGGLRVDVYTPAPTICSARLRMRRSPASPAPLHPSTPVPSNPDLRPPTLAAPLLRLLHQPALRSSVPGSTSLPKASFSEPNVPRVHRNLTTSQKQRRVTSGSRGCWQNPGEASRKARVRPPRQTPGRIEGAQRLDGGLT